MTNCKIGFIGVGGIMGQGMAHNLVKGGRKLVVWNRSRAAADEFVKETGASLALTPREVIEKTDITYLMLSDLAASTSVYEGEDGVLTAIKAGKSIVDCATLTAERMIELDNAVSMKGGIFLEAPVSGSKGPAASGTLVFLCGGNKELFEKIKPDLDLMGKASFYFGTTGQGSKMKLVVNMTMGSMMSVLAEGLSLAGAAGIPQQGLLDVLDLGACQNPMFKAKGPKMLMGDYDTNFPLKHAQKDMRFAIDLGDQLGQSLPMAAAANEQFKRVKNKHGDQDFSAVFEATKEA